MRLNLESYPKRKIQDYFDRLNYAKLEVILNNNNYLKYAVNLFPSSSVPSRWQSLDCFANIYSVLIFILGASLVIFLERVLNCLEFKY